ncbi:MAG: glycosyl hydrolase family 28-related protein, partial [Solirubrobacteraceae bacterium]|nr:glycosyl hydrolase family 28-related protein [Solirubrobacteraceae bacterium]
MNTLRQFGSLPLSITFAMALALAGCGGGNGASSSTATTTTTTIGTSTATAAAPPSEALQTSATPAASPDTTPKETLGTPSPIATTFPADAGAINVKAYGAVGDGVNDDTAAIRAAIRASNENFGMAWWRNRIIFFPEGTYLISDTLDKKSASGAYLSGMVLVGASRSKTIIRLKPNTPAYADRANPKAMIFTSSTLLTSSPTAGGKDYAGKGEGNDAYANYVEAMTIDVGSGNPGAIAVDYLANNMGALRDLAITAPSGSGAIAIAMDRKWPGPALISNVVVSGFDVGVSVSGTEYGITFDMVVLKGQRSVALRNAGNALSINDMSIDGNAIGIQNPDPRGLIVAVDVRFSGSAASTAIENSGHMTLRQIKTSKAARFFNRPAAAGAVFEGVYLG